MRMATATLAWLNTLTEHPQAGAAFCRPPLAGRVAYSILHFAEILLSDKATKLVVSLSGGYTFYQYFSDTYADVTLWCPAAVGQGGQAGGELASGLQPYTSISFQVIYVVHVMHICYPGVLLLLEKAAKLVVSWHQA
jgi:hypothetical protein